MYILIAIIRSMTSDDNNVRNYRIGHVLLECIVYGLYKNIGINGSEFTDRSTRGQRESDINKAIYLTIANIEFLT